ncbi:helix-turn-helix domain-containing protein [Flammeovirga yaeyamensis]|uniref:Helix-turn-helix domain-containing protein n=1 Tax=Flammeovirga yaeyamensis TaxID=367791 RepID=A0AAX1N080_9BACT|nr:AraC family transcriptional regulator [Flammeovirga yaeyamensis]MBB3700158.1 AraC-like DNA-binding protein [Flammeovirga yaeyamensis]NMF37212.1 helix-turn-helix transcriptional regulator [Flammeovirga yaeyamensis]QWG00901.1 helix-turn-helix domain-containing protein [Flammeovirga yaeyamensis]
MQEVLPILKVWQSKLGGEINNNTLLIDNDNCIGKIESFSFSEEVQILRFDFTSKKVIRFSGLDFKDDEFIPIFFEEPTNNTIENGLELIEGQKKEEYDFDLHGAFCTNSKSNLTFDFNTKKPIKFLSIRLTKDLFQRFINKSEVLTSMLDLSQAFYVVEEFNQLIAGSYMRAMNIHKDELFSDELMYSVGLHLVTAFFSKLSERELITDENKYPINIQAVVQARNLIRLNWDKQYSLEKLSKECGLGTSRLRFLFKQTFGVTIHQFQNDVKLEQARKMLLQNKLSIYMIAVELGFSSSSHFAAVFKKKFNITPSNYQKKYLKN